MDAFAAEQFGVSSLTPFEDSTALLDDGERLRERAARDGYLFFRGLLDPDAIRQLREASLEVIDRHGLRVADAEPLSGKLDLARLGALPLSEMRVDIGVTGELYFELQKLPELHRLPHHPSLLNLYRVLLGEDVFVHPRHIMRAMTPHPIMGPTPPHQDFPLIQGSADTWTCWFPVGDCPTELGPLIVLRDSHHNGYVPVQTAAWGGEETTWGAQLCEHETDWVGGEFAIGDVLTFPSFTIHAASPATRRDEIRLSMDIRYQRATDVIEERSLTNHSDRSWDEVYEGWTDEHADLKYYWASNAPALTPWDETLLEPHARRIC